MQRAIATGRCSAQSLHIRYRIYEAIELELRIGLQFANDEIVQRVRQSNWLA